MQLHSLNQLPLHQLKAELTKCCGASAWVEKMTSLLPFISKEDLMQKADEVWETLTEQDWLEAFQHHPKIGNINSLKEKFASTAGWASGEQASVQLAPLKTIEQLALGNQEYEAKFSYIFIVCATSKSAEEMLEILRSRLPNNAEDEIKIAAAEQAKITRIRLEKLLA